MYSVISAPRSSRRSDPKDLGFNGFLLRRSEASVCYTGDKVPYVPELVKTPFVLDAPFFDRCISAARLVTSPKIVARPGFACRPNGVHASNTLAPERAYRSRPPRWCKPLAKHILLEMREFAVPATGIVALALTACSQLDFGVDEPAQDPFEAQVVAESDPGQPVAGVEIQSGTRVVAKTDATGIARIRFGGKDGDQVELTVKCPADYDSPSAPLVVPLRRLAKGSQLPKFEARCAPALRTVVVGVRAEKGPNLPVVYLGRTVARTDASGAAIFTAKVRPTEQVAVLLGTGEKGAEQLRPQSPTLTFVAKDYDDFVVLDQAFTVEKKPAHYQPRPINRPTPLLTTQ